MPDRLDEPFSRSELARQAGVSATTLANWRDRKCEHPLQTLKEAAGGESFTWRLLLDFCRSNPSLPKVREVNNCYRQLFGAAEPVSDPRAAADPLDSDGAQGSAGPHEVDARTLRVLLQDLQGAVDASAEILAAAAELVEDANRGQRDIAARLDLAIRTCGNSTP